MGINKPQIGVLAVQGAFIEHERILKSLGAEVFEIRQLRDLDRHLDGLVLPGGESTVQGKLLRDLGLFEPLRKKIAEGLPVLATCAGAILLAEHIAGENKAHFATLPAIIRRNAYGRQLGSFFTENEVTHVGKVPQTFIRAPFFESVGNGVEVLSRTASSNTTDAPERIVAVRYRNQIALSFHPELNSDTSIHQYFLKLVG
ncbi:MAG: pyridoxal 5'-phosphate synthase glutaminase subunit PdxT [Fibrobacter sp.]|uniref:pyridoxal 5'-phosphate synthase glutaminase subunit PdxT n=1 Tax=Fibrobacter sp. TaxID=35828 RepID=UPI0025C042B5|nr:pyridoxal 5'-phosphate synthase glutaminase subunit PdxT [Fibrobacter sp.]MBQ3714851.1 pyridoxal 5'-phosphate synthase glutaminase subunit PdxT [Fibrobacter sp.]MBQ7079938.1 pyridoxal 5'-phosphate synthase glutaminase subunit PdxT [Fibrobacter sp.]